LSAAKPVVLFVDDEKELLDGLRRGLYAMRNEWTLLFAYGADEALDLLSRQRVDAVVSDMRMPKMDGAALLGLVQQRQPWAARIILSGFSEREAVFRTVGPAHQYYPKPCPPLVLADGIKRALAFRMTLQDPRLSSIVSGANTIPTLPEALTDLLRALGSNDGSASEVAKIIGADPSLAVSLLKITNSGFFYLPSPVSDVLQAVKILGFEMIRSLAIVAGIFDRIDSSKTDLPMIHRLVHRSLQIGHVSKQIADKTGLSPTISEEAHCAGLLSHVGSLLLFANRPNFGAELQENLDLAGSGILSVERRLIGGNHAEIGGVLLGLWGFADPVVDAVLYHHQPRLSPTQSKDTPLLCVHVAQQLLKVSGNGPAVAAVEGLDMDYLTKLGVVAQVPIWAEIAARIRQDSTR
jgi:HD-like signal output (HDOD) protein